MFSIKQGSLISIAILVCILVHTASGAGDDCPEVVLHTCDQLSEKYSESVVEKCKKGMHILWKRGTVDAKQQLTVAAIVEDFYEHKDEKKLPFSMRMGCFRGKNGRCRRRKGTSSGRGCTPRRRGKRCNKNKGGKRPDCKGANAASVACGVASLALGFLTAGVGALAGFGCAVAGGAIAGICGV